MDYFSCDIIAILTLSCTGKAHISFICAYFMKKKCHKYASYSFTNMSICWFNDYFGVWGCRWALDCIL